MRTRLFRGSVCRIPRWGPGALHRNLLLPPGLLQRTRFQDVCCLQVQARFQARVGRVSRRPAGGHLRIGPGKKPVRDLDTLRGGDPLATIGFFNQRFLVTKTEAQAIEQAWQVEPGRTMFHVMNAYTRAAQNPGLDTEEAHKLEKVGGLILSLVKRWVPWRDLRRGGCNTVLRTPRPTLWTTLSKKTNRGGVPRQHSRPFR